MTTPARRPAATAPANDNLMMIVGQLLEATKAASDGLKSMSAEIQSNAKTIIAVTKTLEMLEDKAAEIDRIIRDSTNAGNLLVVTQGHTTELAGVRQVVESLRKTLEELRTEVGKLGNTHANISSQGKLVWQLVIFIGWAITTGIAVYGALQGK